MSRFAWPALLLALVACGTTPDDRPRNAQYITDTILAPTCGLAECHSTFVETDNVVLDTYEGMRHAMVDNMATSPPLTGAPLLSFDDDQYDPISPENSTFIKILTQVDPIPGVDRMPLDSPMANADVELLKAWITGPVNKVDDEAACQLGVTACPQLADTCVVPDGQTIGECFVITYPQPALGAECDPAQYQGLACNDNSLYMCGDDWNFGTLVQVCDGGCEQGVCQ
jgi:hypothetical protein